MKNLLQRLLGFLSAIVAAPLVAWFVTVFVEHQGLRRVDLSFAIAARGSIDLAISQKASDLPAPQWAAAIVIGLAVAFLFIIAAAVLLGWLLPRTRAQHTPALIVLVGAAAGYVWLAWDEALPPAVDAALLQPNPGVARAPRELALIGTKDPQFGHAIEWPQTLSTPYEEDPSEEWLRQHADTIRADWQTLEPVRDWVRQINAQKGFDDYCTAYAEPIPHFKPLQQFMIATAQMARLAAAEDQSAQALAILSDALLFGRRLREGSRSLGTLMIGAIIEKNAVNTLAKLAQQHSVPTELKAKLIQQLRAPNDERADLSRALLNESVAFRKGILSLSRFSMIGRPSPARWESAVLPLIINQHATIARMQAEWADCAQAVRNNDRQFIQTWLEARNPKTQSLHLKNPGGSIMIHSEASELPILKIFDQLESLRAKRAETLKALGEDIPAVAPRSGEGVEST